MRNPEEIYEELGAATLAQERHHSVMGEDSTFEDGVVSALLWVMCSPGQTSLMKGYLQEFEKANEDLKAEASL